MATKKSKNMLLSLGLLAVTGVVAALYSGTVLSWVKKVGPLANIDQKIGDNANQQTT
jgi:hypothetical protein